MLVGFPKSLGEMYELNVSGFESDGIRGPYGLIIMVSHVHLPAGACVLANKCERAASGVQSH